MPAVMSPPSRDCSCGPEGPSERGATAEPWPTPCSPSLSLPLSLLSLPLPLSCYYMEQHTGTRLFCLNKSSWSQAFSGTVGVAHLASRAPAWVCAGPADCPRIRRWTTKLQVRVLVRVESVHERVEKPHPTSPPPRRYARCTGAPPPTTTAARGRGVAPCARRGTAWRCERRRRRKQWAAVGSRQPSTASPRPRLIRGIRPYAPRIPTMYDSTAILFTRSRRKCGKKSRPK